MSAHAYPKAAVLADAGRAGAGLLIAALPLGVAHASPWMAMLLALIAGIFVLNGLATARRALVAVDAGEDAIAMRGPWPARVRWHELRRLRLAHYSTRRDGSGGWMQLTLTGPGHRRVVVDSRIDGFEILARQAVAAARRRGLPLDGPTIANLGALGIATEPPASRERPAR